MRKDLDALLERMATKFTGTWDQPREGEEPPPWTAEDQYRYRLEAAGTPPKYSSVPWAVELPARAAAWDGRTPWSVTFLGPPGTGKTWAATRLFGGLRVADRDSRRGGLWTSSTALIEAITSAFGSPNEGQALARAKSVHLLLLDDYLAERETDFAAERISHVLCHRYDYLLPTIVSCNAESLQAITAKEPRIASRLGEGIVIKMGAGDRRLERRR